MGERVRHINHVVGRNRRRLGRVRFGRALLRFGLRARGELGAANRERGDGQRCASQQSARWVN